MAQVFQPLKDRLAPVVQIIVDAGGDIVGRTKLQKTVYLLWLAGFENQFRFGYKHYGPFSEGLAEAADLAAAFDLISESKQEATRGGSYYSIYKTAVGAAPAPSARVQLAQQAARSDAVLLELAATAAYLAKEGKSQPWAETSRRKPDKAADGRLDRAKELYAQLRRASGNALPDIAKS